MKERPYKSKEDYVANTPAAIEVLRRPGVNMVVAANKIINGQDSGRPCVRVGVRRKIPREQLSAAELLPAKIGGVETDVIQTGRITAFGDPMARHRPVIGGISGHADVGSYGATIGGVVLDSTTGQLVALTCNHCAGLLYDSAYAVPTGGRASVNGIDFLQPSPGDGGEELDRIGAIIRAEPMRFGTVGGTPANAVDAALASIDNRGDAWFNILDLHDGPFLFATDSDYEEGAAVAKAGRTTGLTQGVITSKYASVNVEYGDGGESNTASFANQIYIDTPGFIEPGDSGALLMAIIGGQIKVIGLLFAGGEDIALANHISDVSNLLQIEEWDASIVVPRSISTEIEVEGIVFLRMQDTIARPISHVVS